MKTCIQCNAQVDFLKSTFTLYQVDGERYLYCEACKSPREPYIDPAEIERLNVEIVSCKKALSQTKKLAGVLLLIGFAFGYLISF
jgi:hypothetical protein